MDSISPDLNDRTMLHSLGRWFCPIPDMPVWMFFLRTAWIVIQFIGAYCLANQVDPFLYQRF
jgi:hypothetical protein